MPQIIVTAGSAKDSGEAAVMLRERVNATDFESERFTANLLERLGWAVEDATEKEHREFRAEGAMPEAIAPEQQRDWDPEPAGIA